MISANQIQKILQASLKQLSEQPDSLASDEVFEAMKNLNEILLKNTTDMALQMAQKQIDRVADNARKRKKVEEDNGTQSNQQSSDTSLLNPENIQDFGKYLCTLVKNSSEIVLGEGYYILAQCFEKYFKRVSTESFYFFQAIKLYQFSVYCNYTPANFQLGKHYFLGNKAFQFEQDYKRAHEYFLVGARKDCYKSQIMMANTYLKKPMVIIDLFQIRDDYELKEIEIESEIELYYQNNEGQDKIFKVNNKDVKSAIEYLESACSHSIIAMVELLEIYMGNIHKLPVQDMNKCLELSEKVAIKEGNNFYHYRQMRLVLLIKLFEDQSSSYHDVKKALKCNMEMVNLFFENEIKFRKESSGFSFIAASFTMKLSAEFEKSRLSPELLVKFYYNYKEKCSGINDGSIVALSVKKIEWYIQLESAQKKEEREIMDEFFGLVPSFTPLKRFVSLIQLYTLDPIEDQSESILKNTMGSSNING